MACASGSASAYLPARVSWMTLPLCANRFSASDGPPSQRLVASARLNTAIRFLEIIKIPPRGAGRAPAVSRRGASFRSTRPRLLSELHQHLAQVAGTGHPRREFQPQCPPTLRLHVKALGIA